MHRRVVILSGRWSWPAAIRPWGCSLKNWPHAAGASSSFRVPVAGRWKCSVTDWYTWPACTCRTPTAKGTPKPWRTSRPAGGVQSAAGRGWEEGFGRRAGEASEIRGRRLAARLRWIGREPGSGAHQCLTEIRDQQQSPRHFARSHRGVAETISTGLADAGVCLPWSAIKQDSISSACGKKRTISVLPLLRLMIRDCGHWSMSSARPATKNSSTNCQAIRRSTWETCGPSSPTDGLVGTPRSPEGCRPGNGNWRSIHLGLFVSPEAAHPRPPTLRSLPSARPDYRIPLGLAAPAALPRTSIIMGLRQAAVGFVFQQ